MSKDTSTIYICRGKDCRKHLDTVKDIEKRLGGDIEICAVRCQKICSPLVVGVRTRDRLVWVKKVKSRKDVSALEQWVEDGRCPKRLKSRRVKKRQNKLRQSHQA